MKSLAGMKRFARSPHSNLGAQRRGGSFRVALSIPQWRGRVLRRLSNDAEKSLCKTMLEKPIQELESHLSAS
jgi:hypothetical protein